MDLQLSDKVAIVTGASRGIGRAIAETLGAEGMQLVVAARSRDQLDDLATSLPARCLVQAVDLREPGAPEAVVEAAVGYFGRLDLVVNNAGATRRGDFLALPDVDWDDGFRLKFFGAMRFCRAAWPHLRARQGSIVNIVGIGGRTASAAFTIGGAVNAALLNLTKALADRGVADGVRVNAINPGLDRHRSSAGTAAELCIRARHRPRERRGGDGRVTRHRTVRRTGRHRARRRVPGVTAVTVLPWRHCRRRRRRDAHPVGNHPLAPVSNLTCERS
jgi:NAD(P)-dependent dehydrogenase (short-subunit alcohol dehydrogenase family)